MAASTQELKNFAKDMADGRLDGLHISDRSGLELTGQLMAAIESTMTTMQWNGGAEGLNGTSANTEAVSDGNEVESTLNLALTNDENFVWDLNSVDLTVTVTPSGAAANKFIDKLDGNGFKAWAGGEVITLVSGEASFKVKADYSGNTLVATLSAGPSGISLDSTYTITGS